MPFPCRILRVNPACCAWCAVIATMARPNFFPLSLAVTGALLAAAIPAAAQFGSIFGNDPPPRPPQSVPGRPPVESWPPPPGVSAPPSLPQQRPPGGVQSQPLPPPPGSASTPNVNAPAQPPGGGPVTIQRQPRGAQQPVDTSQPPDEVIAEPPANKVPNPTGVFAGLDKITGRITSFEVAIGETVQFGALQVTPRACYTRPPTETPHTDAFIEVDEVTLQGEIRRIYTGWMFAASPGLHAVEHPIYDIWLTDCKGGVVAEAAPEAGAQQRPSRSQPQQQSPQQQRRTTAPR